MILRYKQRHTEGNFLERIKSQLLDGKTSLSQGEQKRSKFTVNN